MCICWHMHMGELGQTYYTKITSDFPNELSTPKLQPNFLSTLHIRNLYHVNEFLLNYSQNSGCFK